LAGWWDGADIDLKERLGLLRSQDAVSSRRLREQERLTLLAAFRRQKLLLEDEEVTSDDFARAAHEYLALSGSALVLVQLDDLLGERDQVNVPGTSDACPNWRRKYRLPVEGIAADESAWRRLGRLPNLRSPRETQLRSTSQAGRRVPD